MPRYNGYYVNYIVHSNQEGVFQSASVDDNFKNQNVIEAEMRVNEGDKVETFKGANNAIGTLFLHFNTREEMIAALNHQEKWLKLNIK